MKKKKLLPVLVAAALSLSCFTAVPIVSQAEGATEAPVERVIMYRLYNPNSGEHFYTGNEGEKNNLVMLGWRDEGIGWTAPESSKAPVYRLYNPNAGEHHYTTAMTERNTLVSAGWNDEGIGWYSDDAESVPVYREYNPNAVTGTHNYTTDKSEHDNLVSLGWQDEGIGWYGINGNSQEPAEPEKPGGTLTVDKSSVEIDIYSDPIAYVHVSYAEGVSFEGLISDTTVIGIERLNETDTGCDIKITGKKAGDSTLTLLSSGDYSGPQDNKVIAVSVKDSTPLTNIISANKDSIKLDLNGNASETVLVKLTIDTTIIYHISDSSIVSCRWGEWVTDDDIELFITAQKAGSAKVTITNDYNDETVVINVTVKSSPKIGDTVILGTYEQDNDLLNGPEPIEWQVLGTRDGHTFLLSKYALDCNRYHEINGPVTWEGCTLRSWLNNDFYNTAFSDSDKERIAVAHNENPDTYELYKTYYRDAHIITDGDSVAGAEGGYATNDLVFLLSWTEARDYLDGKLFLQDLGAKNYNEKLLCWPTAYAKARRVFVSEGPDSWNVADVEGCCWWWLRSPGHYQSQAGRVFADGSLDEYTVDAIYIGVRPAILID